MTTPNEQVIAEANLTYWQGVPTGAGSAILTDEDDSTYVTITPGTSSWQVKLDLLGDYTGMGYTNVRVEIEAEAMGADGFVSWGFNADFPPDHPGANYFSFGWDFSPTAQNPGDDNGQVLISGRRKYVQEITSDFVYFHPEEWSVDTFLERVADNSNDGSGAYQHVYGGLNGYYSNSAPIRVYRFVVIAYTPTARHAPPLRQYPRSPLRHWPPERSYQRSNRKAGGYL